MRLRPLTPTFGAEVTGVRLEQLAGGAPSDLLVDALLAHRLLLFRGSPLDAGRQLRITAAFGRVTPPWDPTHAHPEDDRVELFRESAPRAYKRPAEHWHSDASFLARPTDVTLLHAVVVPDRGGRTSFTDTRAALEALPGELRDRIGPLRAVHDFARSFSALRQSSSRVSAATAVRERERFPAVRHPLARPHPVHGRVALYLNELCLDRVEGVPPEEGSRLLAEVYAHTLRPRWRYTHRWRAGDLLVWDNPSLLHRGEAVPPGQHRTVHRTTAAYVTKDKGTV
jgi:taurine dioxygenase